MNFISAIEILICREHLKTNRSRIDTVTHLHDKVREYLKLLDN